MWRGTDSILFWNADILPDARSHRRCTRDRLSGRRSQRIKATDSRWFNNSRCPLSWSANVVIRLIQIHMCIIYFCSGVAKLHGATWWNGMAVWQVLATPDVAKFNLKWLANLEDWEFSLIFRIAAAATIALEIGFPFLIWSRRLRPVVLCGAALLHLAIGLFMGLGLFSAAMLAGCVAFVSAASQSRCV